MRRVRKGAPPPVLADLRRTPGATWASVHGDQKEQLRDVAVREQGGLCAYCNQVLRGDSTTTIEHWRPRSDPATDEFAWEDMLAVCPGGTPKQPTCDRSRGKRPLTLHPARAVPDVEKIVRFRLDGQVNVDAKYRHEVCEVLGLDAPLLVLNRKEAVDALLRVIDRSTANQRRRLLDAWDTEPKPFPTLLRPLLARKVALDNALSQRVRGER
jgi:uncharacterized protein (TIGR02646 family)